LLGSIKINALWYLSERFCCKKRHEAIIKRKKRKKRKEKKNRKTGKERKRKKEMISWE
jgi:hypothetical protein